jgi:pimeloyl-ACP methyl ester carboxylesterase
MSILSELRYPTRWYTQLLTIIMALVFFAALATAGFAGFLVYRIVKPQRTSSDINLQSFPGRPEAIEFTVLGKEPREGLFFPGLRGAPTIVLCHGYGSNRTELLTLVSALQDHQYNVFLFDFAAHGNSGGMTTFGYREADELASAIDAVAARNDVDPHSFGVWGYNLGAYAALREAERDPRIRALVLDSVYDKPDQMVKIGVERAGLAGFPWMVRFAEFSFEMLNLPFRNQPPVSARFNALNHVPILFIQATDDPELASTAREIFLKAPEPREQAIIGHGNYVSMGDDEKRVYENRVVTFFLARLPATGRPFR